MAPGGDLGATFVPGGWDDYYMPEVVAPSPQRVTPQVPQNMQEDLQRMELEARETSKPGSDSASRHTRDPSLSTWMRPSPQQQPDNSSSSYNPPKNPAMASAAPNFSRFPVFDKKNTNIPPSDDEKEAILFDARDHVLGSQNVSMQITWARDVLNWAEIMMEAATRDYPNNRPATPETQHRLREDARNIITYLAGQEHPEALYIKSKWLEFGKFGNRVDKREAYNGYKKATDLGQTRAEYRIGMLFEQSNDTSKAKEHYYKGLGYNDSAAKYRLGMMSLLGQLGEAKDYQTGLERIKSAADSADEDSPQGAFVYGMLVSRELPDIYIPDSLLPNNLDTARMYIEKAAYLGFAKAQHKMGQAYELCQLNCEFNAAYSLHYYGLAANQGNAEAALGVSRWFLFGYEGVFEKNEEFAYKYAQQAANQKLPTGEFAMGYYSEIGIHVPKSVTEARKWYQIAADHGNKDAVGRLESLSQDKTLSKTDHETTTLGRIKSQHGSQRGKRPDRFKQQPAQMPTLNEDARGSPRPGAGPGAPPKSQGPAPYPEDDRTPYPPGGPRPKSAAPYPEDDMRGPGYPGGPPPHGRGPQADRPGSAFGVAGHGHGPPPGGRGMPASQSMGNLHPSAQHPDPRGRVSSTGGPAPGNFRQPSPGGHHGPYPSGDPGHGRPGSAAPYPGGPPGGGAGRYSQGGIPPAGTLPGGRGQDPRMSQPNLPYGQPDRHTPGPQDGRLGAMPPQQQRHSQVPTGAGRRPVGNSPGPDRTGSAPPGQMPRPDQKPSPAPSPAPSAATMPVGNPPKPQSGKGPATFEDMGIPQGKQGGDCVMM